MMIICLGNAQVILMKELPLSLQMQLQLNKDSMMRMEEDIIWLLVQPNILRAEQLNSSTSAMPTWVQMEM